MGRLARNILDYGYTCKYAREIKKRGRAPTSSTTTTTPHGGAKHSSLDAMPPSPPLASPETTAQSVHLSQSHARHRSSFALSHDDGRPSIARILTGQPSPSAGGPSPYLASPIYSSGPPQMQLSSLLEPTSEPQPMRTSQHGSPPQAPKAETIASEESASVAAHDAGGFASSHAVPRFQRQASSSYSNAASSIQHGRGSFSASTTRDESVPEKNSLYKAPSSDCRYRCLDPVLPYLSDIIPASVACDLLDVYLTEPGSSLFRCASPYIITRVFRKKSLLHPTAPRRTTPALLATMLWCSAQTADIVLLHVPGSRARICNALYELCTALITERDPDRWRRIHGTIAPNVPGTLSLLNA